MVKRPTVSQQVIKAALLDRSSRRTTFSQPILRAVYSGLCEVPLGELHQNLNLTESLAVAAGSRIKRASRDNTYRTNAQHQDLKELLHKTIETPIIVYENNQNKSYDSALQWVQTKLDANRVNFGGFNPFTSSLDDRLEDLHPDVLEELRTNISGPAKRFAFNDKEYEFAKASVGYDTGRVVYQHVPRSTSTNNFLVQEIAAKLNRYDALTKKPKPVSKIVPTQLSLFHTSPSQIPTFVYEH